MVCGVFSRRPTGRLCRGAGGGGQGCPQSLRLPCSRNVVSGEALAQQGRHRREPVQLRAAAKNFPATRETPIQAESAEVWSGR